MLVVALIGGVHAGSASGGQAAAVLCGHGTSGPAGEQPATNHDDPCCVAGSLTHGPALDTPPPSVAAPTLAGGTTITAAALPSLVRGTVLFSHRQRGPPSFA